MDEALWRIQNWTLGTEFEISRSESDSSIPFGDHDLIVRQARFNSLFESQTDLFAGYQEEFFGWPGMYTAVPTTMKRKICSQGFFHSITLKITVTTTTLR